MMLIPYVPLMKMSKHSWCWNEDKVAEKKAEDRRLQIFVCILAANCLYCLVKLCINNTI